MHATWCSMMSGLLPLRCTEGWVHGYRCSMMRQGELSVGHAWCCIASALSEESMCSIYVQRPSDARINKYTYIKCLAHRFKKTPSKKQKKKINCNLHCWEILGQVTNQAKDCNAVCKPPRRGSASWFRHLDHVGMAMQACRAKAYKFNLINHYTALALSRI